MMGKLTYFKLWLDNDSSAGTFAGPAEKRKARIVHVYFGLKDRGAASGRAALSFASQSSLCVRVWFQFQVDRPRSISRRLQICSHTYRRAASRPSPRICPLTL